MSIHSSLRVSGAGAGQRNVWTRAERIAPLKQAGKWKDGDKVVGLQKVRTGFKAKKKPKEAAAPAAGAPAAGAPAAGAAAAAPAAAAGTAPAKDAKAAAPAKDTKAAPAKK